MSVKCFKHSRRDCDECMEPVSGSLTMSEVKYTDALLKAADAMADAIDRTGMVSGDNDPMRIAVANYRALSLGEPQTKENPLETMEWYEGHGKPHPHIPGSKNVVCLNAEDFAEALAGFRDAVKDRDALRAQLTAAQEEIGGLHKVLGKLTEKAQTFRSSATNAISPLAGLNVWDQLDEALSVAREALKPTVNASAGERVREKELMIKGGDLMFDAIAEAVAKGREWPPVWKIVGLHLEALAALKEADRG